MERHSENLYLHHFYFDYIKFNKVTSNRKKWRELCTLPSYIASNRNVNFSFIVFCELEIRRCVEM
jgi:hypothetical protein